MTDIPDDIFAAALDICLTRAQAVLIAKLVLAERKRCMTACAIGQGCEHVRDIDGEEQGQPTPLGLGDILRCDMPSKKLTKGKLYDVISSKESNHYVKVEDDDGVIREYGAYRFSRYAS